MLPGALCRLRPHVDWASEHFPRGARGPRLRAPRPCPHTARWPPRRTSRPLPRAARPPSRGASARRTQGVLGGQGTAWRGGRGGGAEPAWARACRGVREVRGTCVCVVRARVHVCRRGCARAHARACAHACLSVIALAWACACVHACLSVRVCVGARSAPAACGVPPGAGSLNLTQATFRFCDSHVPWTLLS